MNIEAKANLICRQLMEGGTENYDPEPHKGCWFCSYIERFGQACYEAGRKRAFEETLKLFQASEDDYKFTAQLKAKASEPKQGAKK